MFEAIENAKESVYLEMYIFTEDMLQYDFFKLLKEKARRGISVKVILDSFGSMSFSGKAVAGFKEVGVEMLFFNHLFHGTHRKILVVDEERAFIGGVNFSQKFLSWDDLMVEMRGTLVKYIVRSFAKVYVECGGKDPKIVAKNRTTILDETRTWLVENFPSRKKFILKKLYKEHLSKAEKSIILSTPYFVPNFWLIGVLHQAVLRGVKVEILIPKTTDRYIINHFFMFKLAKLGVLFYLGPKMNHSKIMIIDDKEGMVGSQNLDFYLFR